MTKLDRLRKKFITINLEDKKVNLFIKKMENDTYVHN